MPAKNASSEKQRSKHYAPRISSPQPAASTNLLNATSIEQVGALTHLDVLRACGKHEARYAFARFEFMHAVGQATHLFVQVVDFLIALVETTLQIQNSNDARKVDALTRELR